MLIINELSIYKKRINCLVKDSYSRDCYNIKYLVYSISAKQSLLPVRPLYKNKLKSWSFDKECASSLGSPLQGYYQSA